MELPEMYPQPLYPEGTPEYEAYRAELQTKLDAWVQRWKDVDPLSFDYYTVERKLGGKGYSPYGRRSRKDLGITEEDAELLLKHLSEDKEEKA